VNSKITYKSAAVLFEHNCCLSNASFPIRIIRMGLFHVEVILTFLSLSH